MAAPSYDFNSHGKPDYVLYQANTRRTAIWYLDNNIYQGSAFGPSLPPDWALIDVADFNSDTYADYALLTITRAKRRYGI